MVKFIATYSLPKGMDGDEFWGYHTGPHAKDYMKIAGPGLIKYVIKRVVKPMVGEQQFFALIEMWWETQEDMDKEMDAARKTTVVSGKTIADDFMDRVTDYRNAIIEEFVVKEP